MTSTDAATGARWCGCEVLRSRRPRPRRSLGRSRSGRPGGAPPLEVHHRTGAGVGRAWPGRTLRGGPPRGTDAGRDRVGRSGGAPARRRQARPRAGQRPGHAPGSVQRPVVWSRGARSAFADMSRSVSVAPARVNPRPWPPNTSPACPRAHPEHRLRPALSPSPRPVHGPTSAAENRGRNSRPRNAAATVSPGSAAAHRPRGPGRGVPEGPGRRRAGSASAATRGASAPAARRLRRPPAQARTRRGMSEARPPAGSGRRARSPPLSRTAAPPRRLLTRLADQAGARCHPAPSGPGPVRQAPEETAGASRARPRSRITPPSPTRGTRHDRGTHPRGASCGSGRIRERRARPDRHDSPSPPRRPRDAYGR